MFCWDWMLDTRLLSYILPHMIHLNHWDKVTHICVNKLTIIGSDNGLSPGRRQAIIWTNVAIVLIWPLGRNFNEISIEIDTFSFKKIHLKTSPAKWRPFCLGLNVLMHLPPIQKSSVECWKCCSEGVVKGVHLTLVFRVPFHYSNVTWVPRRLDSPYTRCK